MSSTFELHGFETGNCLRVSVALEEAGLPYSVKIVDLRRGQHYGSEHMSLNPAGKVPTIIERREGRPPFVLSQSNAIIMHIDQRAPGILFPTDKEKRAIAFERFFYFVTDVIGPGMSAFRVRRNDDAFNALLESSLGAWSESARFLDDSRYMAGDDFSAADIAAAVFIRAYERHIDWEAMPPLKRWYDDVSSRPGFRKGMSAFNV